MTTLNTIEHAKACIVDAQNALKAAKLNPWIDGSEDIYERELHYWQDELRFYARELGLEIAKLEAFLA